MAKGLQYYNLFPGESHIVQKKLCEVCLVEKGLFARNFLKQDSRISGFSIVNISQRDVFGTFNLRASASP